VLTGEAAVTIGAVGQGMVAGDLVNTASRLQSAAPPGTVLVGAATQRAASRAIAFEEAGEQLLKGKAAPVAAWRAVRTLTDRDGRSGGIPEPPFVGRDDELRLLTDLFHATVRERRARLVSVFGPAGIGKSRLAQEFLRYVDGLPEPVRWHDGRSPNYGEGVSFWAVGEMVRSRCGLVEGDDEPTTRARVAATLEGLIDDPEERHWLEPALLALLGVEREVGSEQLFAAWRTFFERLAEQAPVVLVFEDLQFADSGVIAFVDHLLEWIRGVPLFVLTLARPELLEAHPDWATARRSFNSLFLDPLPPEAMRELLEGLVPGLPDPAAAAIVGRADGVPLYAVETVRMLLADGRLELVDGAYRPVDDLAGLAVPDTLTALITSRLDALDPQDRALVSDAAVLGQSFTLGALAAVSGIDEADLDRRLQALVRRELVRVDADPRSPERGQYQFVQGLIRETAYNTLARRDRVRRHLAAARHLESLGSDELAGALAGHYLAARANAPAGPEADALATQARVTLRAAADRASTLGAHRQALAFLEQAIAVTGDEASRAELAELAGSEADTLGDRTRTRELFEEAIGLFRARGDRQAACRASTELVRAQLPRDPEAGRQLLEASLAEFSDLAKTPDGIALRAQAARARYLQHRYAEAVEVADAVLPAAEAADLVPVIADVLVTRGSSLIGLQRPREGVGAIEAGRQLAEEHDLPLTIFRALMNALDVVSEEDPPAGLARALAGIELARRLGQLEDVFVFTEMSAYQAIGLGAWDAALERLDAALAIIDERDQVHMTGWVAAFEVLRGEPPGPRLELVESLLKDVEDPRTLIHDPGLRMTVALATGDRGEAGTAMSWIEANQPDQIDRFYLGIVARLATWEGDASAAAAAVERMREDPHRGRSLASLRAGYEAGLDALAGRTGDAVAGYRASIRGLVDLGLHWEAALMGLDMTVLLDPADPAVQVAAAAARETFTDLQARPFLERLDAALARRPVMPERRADATTVRP
jgi:tetratricopeptide (TPR) repeat protein